MLTGPQKILQTNLNKDSIKQLVQKIKLIPGYPVTHPIYGNVLVSLNEKPSHVAIRANKGEWPIFIESAHFFGTLDWTVENIQCVDFADMVCKAKDILENGYSKKE